MTLLVKKPSHHGPCLSDERGVARKYLLSDVTSDSDALNVDNNNISEKYQYYVIIGHASLISA